MNVKTQPRPVVAKYATKKSSYAARLETLRRKEVRKFKTADYRKTH